MNDAEIVEEIVEIINKETGRYDAESYAAAFCEITALLAREGRFD